MPITVSIVEDDRDVRESLVALLSGDAGETKLSFLSAYSSGEAALKGMPLEKPAVAVIDINLPGMSGIDCVAMLKAKLPDLKMLMLTTYEDSDLIFNSLRAGAQGYLLKKMLPGELILAIEQIHVGGAPMSMQIARKVVDYFHQIRPSSSEVELLTAREQEILTHLAKGQLYKEIGERLGISFSTVRAHLRHIYEKLHVRSRTEATAKFFGRE